MKLDQEAVLALAAVATLLLSCSVPNIEVMAIATDTQLELNQHADNSMHRVRRQPQKNNRGFFGLIYDYFTETRDDTMRAYREIQDLVSKTIVPKPRGIQLNTTDPELARELPDNATETTTEASYLLTQDELFRLFRRNIRGLARLFNRESRKAIQDSNKNVQVLRKQLQEVVRPYVEPTNSTT